MTDHEITQLLQARDKICVTASILDIPADTRSIDALLSTVPAGRDNRVDLALGSSCAKLPERADYGLQADLDMTRRIWQTTPPEAY